MTFKELYQNSKKNMKKAVEGEKVTFTHRAFFGWEFQIIAKRKKGE